MKIKVNNYTFNKTAKTVTFTDYASVSLDGILLVTNVTSNVIVYNFANPALGGVVAGNVLTLTYDTVLMSDSDRLQIFYEDSALNSATSENQATQKAILDALLVMAGNSNDTLKLMAVLKKNLEPISTQDANQRQRVSVDNAVVVTGTLTAVTTVANAAALGGVDYRFQIIDQARNTYSNGARRNLTIT